MSCSNHLTEIENMILFNDEEVLAGIGWSSRYRSSKMSTSLLTRRGSRTVEFRGTYVSDPRPTKQEGKKQLEFLTTPFRIVAPLSPPLGRPILVGAPRLAEILIEIDPQERYRD